MIAIPDIFFAQILPKIQDMVELKVTLYIFHLLNQKREHSHAPRQIRGGVEAGHLKEAHPSIPLIWQGTCGNGFCCPLWLLYPRGICKYLKYYRDIFRMVGR